MDPEVAALEAIYEFLGDFTYAEQRRMVDWLSARIDADEMNQQFPPVPSLDHGFIDVARRA